MTRVEKIGQRLLLLEAEIRDGEEIGRTPSQELLREFEGVKTAKAKFGSPSLAIARREDVQMYQLFRYVCTDCGFIVEMTGYQSEATLRCPLCGHNVLFWSRMEADIEDRR